MRCLAPFIHLGTFFGDGKYTPCCYRKMDAINATHYNSPELRELRLELSGAKPLRKACEDCLRYKHSSVAQLYAKSEQDYPVRFNTKTGEVENSPYHGNLFVGSKCNLACRMCNGFVSDKFNHVFPERASEPLNTDDYPIPDLTGIKHLCLAGGEPFINKQSLVAAEKVIEAGGVAFVITNGSVPLENKPLFKFLEQHKEQCRILVSLDADFETHAWIRVGLDVELLKRNIYMLHEKEMLTSFNMVLSSLNYDKVIPVFELAEELEINIDLVSLDEPSCFTLGSVELDKRVTVAKRYVDFARNTNLSESGRYTMNRIISTLITTPYDPISDEDQKTKDYLSQEIITTRKV